MKQKLNDHPETLRVGDLVVTDFHYGAENVVRRLLSIEPDDNYGSGYHASASAGYGTPKLEEVDAAWFLPAPKDARPIDEAEVNRLTTELTAAVASTEEAEAQLLLCNASLYAYDHKIRDLLAVIHRDGGQHAEEYGVTDSVKSAINVVCEYRTAIDAAVADLALNAGMLARQTDLARQAEADRDEYKRRADAARAARPWSGYVAEIHEADVDGPAVALIEFGEEYDALWLPLSDVPKQSRKLGSRCCIEWCTDTWTHDEIDRARAAATTNFATLTDEPSTWKKP